MIRYTIHFTGRVQGVGFRYTVMRIGENHKAAGFVQNLHDGRVLLAIEGTSADLDMFIADIVRRMGRYVTDHSIAESQATGEFGDPEFGAITVRY